LRESFHTVCKKYAAAKIAGDIGTIQIHRKTILNAPVSMPRTASDPHLPLVAIEQGAGHAPKPTFAPASRKSKQRYINVQRLEVAAAAASG
jgi:hypothetical protein